MKNPCIRFVHALFLMFGLLPTGQAILIEHNVDVLLSTSQILPFGPPNERMVIPGFMPSTFIGVGDTLRVNVSFTNGRVQWVDLGESIEVATANIMGLYPTIGWSTSYTSDFRFIDPIGDLNFNSFVKSTSSGGLGILAGTANIAGQENLTDGVFSFSGMMFEVAITGLTSGPTAGIPFASNQFELWYQGGDYSVLENTRSVYEPGMLVLFSAGFIGLFLNKRIKGG